MANNVDKPALIRNFSKYASSYDEYSGAQSEAAGILARILPKGGIANILEIGCGTGNYTAILNSIFKDANIKAIDISRPMVEAARQKLDGEKVAFEVGDVEEIELKGIYDLITSNAVFHWLGDLDGVTKKAKASLENAGALIFSAFGPKTFWELRASLRSAIGRNIAFTPDAFPGKSDMKSVLSKYFKKVRISERLIREAYPCLRDLLRKIKHSGTRGTGADIGKAWSPGLLKKIEDNYLERFGSIEATYQIFFCEAVKCA
ncbi:MAG: methyltransferase domain-containing protein [Candidatus Omnitrophota bacterium]|nr:methyltransferase domain-containing protein [Candidatus Omnitrophota bacterium]